MAPLFVYLLSLLGFQRSLLTPDRRIPFRVTSISTPVVSVRLIPITSNSAAVIHIATPLTFPDASRWIDAIRFWISGAGDIIRTQNFEPDVHHRCVRSRFEGDFL